MRKSDRKYLRVGKAVEELGLHPITIRRWMKMGKIQAVRVGIEARIPRTEIERLLGNTDERLLVLYARVSGHEQRPELERQMERLSAWAKTERAGREMLVLSDIGSGLNAGRKRLRQLLKLVCEDRVAEVVVTYGDRLTRFGQEYLETLFTSFGVAFTMLDLEEEPPPEQELTEDLLSIIASFAGKLYGIRSHKQKELLSCAEAQLHNP
jgi:excisionase family DNA binding protein